MNHIFIRLALLAAPLSIPQIVPRVEARAARASTRTDTVVQYFKLLPDDYFVSQQSRVWMLRGAPVIDTENDYLRTAGSRTQPAITMALFRRGQGGQNVWVALCAHFKGRRTFEMLRLTAGGWKDHTRTLVPRFDSHNFYSIPRPGSTIRVSRATGIKKDQPGAHLYDLAWRDGRFVVR